MKHAKTSFTLKLENSFSMITPKLWRPSASHHNLSAANFTPKSKGQNNFSMNHAKMIRHAKIDVHAKTLHSRLTSMAK